MEDYYAILEVEENVTTEEIKSAFKKQALKWHPDRVQGLDTTLRMQKINEAYLILKDFEARRRYNLEYQCFKQYQKNTEQKSSKEPQKEHNPNDINKNQKKRTNEYSNYKVNDEILNKWMSNAKYQAIDLAKQTIEDINGMVSVGAKAVVKEAGNQIIYQIIISIVVLVIFALLKSCNN